MSEAREWYLFKNRVTEKLEAREDPMCWINREEDGIKVREVLHPELEHDYLRGAIKEAELRGFMQAVADLRSNEVGLIAIVAQINEISPPELMARLADWLEERKP
jgi:hypothetical protein